MLVDRDYVGLERLTNATRLTAEEIAKGVQDYGATLVMPPPDAFNNLDVIEVENAHPSEWSVRMHLWAAGEGKSDLSLELTLKKAEEGDYNVEVDDIHLL